MTTIAFADNALHADTLWSSALVPATYVLGKPKIFISPCEHFAYGIAGAPPSSQTMEGSYFSKTLHLLKIFEKARQLDRGPVSQFLDIVGKEFESTLAHTQIVMGRDFGYVVSALHPDKPDILQPILPGDVAAIGAGWDYFIGAYAATNDVARSFAATARLDCLTGSAYTTIKLSQLKAIPKGDGR